MWRHIFRHRSQNLCKKIILPKNQTGFSKYQSCIISNPHQKEILRRGVSLLQVSSIRQFSDDTNRPTICYSQLRSKAVKLLFEIMSNGETTYSIQELLNVTFSLPYSNVLGDIAKSGIESEDLRLVGFFEEIMELLTTCQDGAINFQQFAELLQEDNVVLEILCKIYSKSMIIPDFTRFSNVVTDIFNSVKSNNAGKLAKYIPQLEKVDPDLWGVSICTVDGQRLSLGDASDTFCLQSCMKPLAYAIAVSELDSNEIHQYMGTEPSGLYFNAISLGDNDKPHNPLINAGMLVVSSLLKPEENLADRFNFMQNSIKKLCGDEYTSFDNPVFLSERETSYRNLSLLYYLKEKKCFPPNTKLESTLDFYLQLCAIKTTCKSASVAASTLANGGVSPLFPNRERLLEPAAVRNTLSLMHSCGMYDYSGKFAFHVGLPAKSGVAGGLLVIIPNVMGIMCRSPLLDEKGNPVRGIQFCRQLVEYFNFHIYDNLRYSVKKKNPRKMSRHITEDEILLQELAKDLFNNVHLKEDLI